MTELLLRTDSEKIPYSYTYIICDEEKATAMRYVPFRGVSFMKPPEMKKLPNHGCLVDLNDVFDIFASHFKKKKQISNLAEFMGLIHKIPVILEANE